MSSSPTIEKSPSKTSELGQKRDSPDLKGPDLGAEHEEHGHGVEWAELVRIAFVALAAAAVWSRLWEPFPHVSVIGITAALIGGYPIFKEALEEYEYALATQTGSQGSLTQRPACACFRVAFSDQSPSGETLAAREGRQDLIDGRQVQTG